MDAMGLAFKKPHTFSTSFSSSFNHEPAESPKFPGIVSTAPLVLVLSEAVSLALPLPAPAALLEFMPPLPSLACCTNFSLRRARVERLCLGLKLGSHFAMVALCLPQMDWTLLDLNASRTQSEFSPGLKLLLILFLPVLII